MDMYFDQQERSRRETNRRKIRTLFLQHPGKWFLASDLESDGGRQAWRTRVSEVRRELLAENKGTIVNRVSRFTGMVVSEYRYLPHDRSLLPPE